MADIPIIFSGTMVSALLAGRKSMTRRLAWRPCKLCGSAGTCKGERKPSVWQKVKPGDRLWVRENFRHWRGSASGKTAVYAADDTWLDHGSGETYVDRVEWLTPKTPSIHMPRWASRLTLIVTAMKVEPLNYITHEDAVAEGASDDGGPGTMLGFINIWNRLHGERAFEDNPHVEVVAITFKVVRANIDAPQAKAA